MPLDRTGLRNDASRRCRACSARCPAHGRRPWHLAVSGPGEAHRRKRRIERGQEPAPGMVPSWGSRSDRPAGRRGNDDAPTCGVRARRRVARAELARVRLASVRGLARKLHHLPQPHGFWSTIHGCGWGRGWRTAHRCRLRRTWPGQRSDRIRPVTGRVGPEPDDRRVSRGIRHVLKTGCRRQALLASVPWDSTIRFLRIMAGWAVSPRPVTATDSGCHRLRGRLAAASSGDRIIRRLKDDQHGLGQHVFQQVAGLVPERRPITAASWRPDAPLLMERQRMVPDDRPPVGRPDLDGSWLDRPTARHRPAAR